MRFNTASLFVLMFLVVLISGCGSQAGCPVCGTTQNGSYALINVIPVPEHNPTGTPGGPFVSFDISVVDPVNHKFYVSDRIGLDVVVVDTVNNVAVNTIGGANEVAQAGNNASACVPTISPLVSALGNFTRFACRTGTFSIPGFGANGLFGGFTGAQCCAARANGVNPLSCPCGIVVTADGKTMFVGNASSAVVVFDLTTNPPNVIADIPTGQSPDFDGPVGVAPCIASAAGRALSDPTCGDMRADEMAYDEKDKILLVTNGDPGIPFATLIDMSAVVARTGNCLPVTPGNPYGPTNFPTCILGQIYYDGVAPLNNSVAVDTTSGPCPDPSTSVNPILAYERLYDSGPSKIEAYRETLNDAPWKSCDCDICQRIGINVILFRGAERNRRRGFHNLFVFYKRLHRNLIDPEKPDAPVMSQAIELTGGCR